MKKSHHNTTIQIQLLLKCLDICFPSQPLFYTLKKKKKKKNHHCDQSVVKIMLLLYLLKLNLLQMFLPANKNVLFSTGFLIGVMKMFWNNMVVMIIQLREYGKKPLNFTL